MRKTLYEGKLIRLMDDDGWEFADRVVGTGVVCIVAIDDRHVILVEEFRRAVQAPVISLPAGLIDRADAGKGQETAIEAAVRELREETGYTARSIEQVASGPISAGMTTERLTFFLAEDLEAGPPEPDGDGGHQGAPGAASAPVGVARRLLLARGRDRSKDFRRPLFRRGERLITSVR